MTTNPLDLIHARSLAGTGTHTRADNQALVKALRAVEAVQPLKCDYPTYDNGYNQALQDVLAAVTEALG